MNGKISVKRSNSRATNQHKISYPKDNLGNYTE